MLKTVYNFDPIINKILLIGLVVGIWGAVADKNKRIFFCLLVAEGMYVVLIYLGMKLEYTGILIFFGLIILLAVVIYVIQRIKAAEKLRDRQ